MKYPALIAYADSVYYVTFPDIPGCYTDGETLQEALSNAEDALQTMIEYYDIQGKSLPSPTDIKSLPMGSGEIVAMVSVDIGEPEKVAV